MHVAHAHHMPTSGRALTSVAISATLHCLTGCAIGEILGMAIGTALGFSNWGTVVLAIAPRVPLRLQPDQPAAAAGGIALAAVIPIALASDTSRIADMELVDNAVVVAVPGAMDAGLGRCCSGAPHLRARGRRSWSPSRSTAG